MKTLARLFLTLLGFGGVAIIAFYVDPSALDAVGFLLFYAALGIGAFHFFLLLRLAHLQSLLLTFLLLSFLLLRQLELFSILIGIILILFVIIIERYGTRYSKH